MPHWLVIDLEATTDDGGWPLAEMEIIEIGATLVNREGRELDHFQRFVRPLRRPLLTLFCRELTHISQAQIDSAAPLGEVWPLFERWLANIGSAWKAGPAGATTTVGSWSRTGGNSACPAPWAWCRISTSSSASPRRGAWSDRWA